MIAPKFASFPAFWASTSLGTLHLDAFSDSELAETLKSQSEGVPQTPCPSLCSRKQVLPDRVPREWERERGCQVLFYILNPQIFPFNEWQAILNFCSSVWKNLTSLPMPIQGTLLFVQNTALLQSNFPSSEKCFRVRLHCPWTRQLSLLVFICLNKANLHLLSNSFGCLLMLFKGSLKAPWKTWCIIFSWEPSGLLVI